MLLRFVNVIFGLSKKNRLFCSDVCFCVDMNQVLVCFIGIFCLCFSDIAHVFCRYFPKDKIKLESKVQLTGLLGQAANMAD